MTTILPRSRFIHVPKTGGTWVCEVLRCSGLQLAACTEPHPPLATSPGQGLFTFAFVRSPLTWYPSYWAYRMRTGWNSYRPFDLDCGSDTFAGFMARVFARHPGYYSSLLSLYVGTPDAPVDFIGRQESLADDLIRALDAAGERYDPGFPATARAHERVNESPICPWPWLPPPHYAERVSEMDAAAFERFGYPRVLRKGVAI